MKAYRGEFCDCCIVAAFNNDTSGHDYSCEDSPEPLCEMEDGHIITAHFYNTRGFSSRKCEGCGEELAGDRTTCLVEIRNINR